MAVMKILCVFDVKAGSYNLPMGYPSIGVGIRDFSDAFSKPDNPMSKHRGDFDLFHIGDFDTVDGSWTPMFPPKLVFKGGDIGGEL